MQYYWDRNGAPLNHIEHAAVWVTCEHDDGYGACRECIEAGEYQYAAQHPTKDITEYDFDTLEDALAYAEDLTPNEIYWDIDGDPVDNEEDAVIWLTCRHSYRAEYSMFEACYDCLSQGDYWYTTNKGRFNEFEEAMASLAEMNENDQ